jgi:hypothetical protein
MDYDDEIKKQNRENQKESRKRKRKKGLKRIEFWVSDDGIFTSKHKGILPAISLNSLVQGLKDIGFEDLELEMIYQELLNYAKYRQVSIKKAIRGKDYVINGKIKKAEEVLEKLRQAIPK